MDDQRVVAVQIGRPLRASIEVASRCPLGLPVVAAVPPLLDDGTPFPTRYWLTCPLACTRVGRLESVGGVKAMDRWAASQPGFAAGLREADRRYAVERDSWLPEGADPRPSGGVGGRGRGVKCLHAHYADRRAGNENPVGELIAPWVEPLDCLVPCVIETDGPTMNPSWSEPK